MILNITSIEYLIPVIGGTTLFGLLLAFIIYFILIYRKTQVKLDFEKERLKSELLRVENEVKEQTLTNVSRELHDNFGQIASLIKINLSMVSKLESSSDQQKITESTELIKQLIGDIKSLSASLNGERISKLGWLKTIAEDIKRINSIGTMQIEYNSDFASTLTRDKEVILYRIIQELFNNSLKYAQAEKAELNIYTKNNTTTISYTDNGIGFDVNKVVLGSGLINIKERCKMINAELKMTSILGKETNFTIIIEK
jgi:signal transduction histidine kinase